MINKPANLNEFDLFVIMGTNDAPQVALNPSKPLFSKSVLAINTITKNVIVYVNADTEKGISKFKEAYPDAVEADPKDFTNTEEWRMLAYPSFASQTDTILDVYYKAKHHEHIETEYLKTIKEEK